MKFTKPFQGVPDGAIYPVHYQAGDECPPELMASAAALESIAKVEELAAADVVVPQAADMEQPQKQADELAPAPVMPAAKPGRRK
ncbi:MAG TPA: hypothetical protein DEP03_14205 [Massilia sp.]|nr:hypothetical protein [Massilia sp.]